MKVECPAACDEYFTGKVEKAAADAKAEADKAAAKAEAEAAKAAAKAKAEADKAAAAVAKAAKKAEAAAKLKKADKSPLCAKWAPNPEAEDSACKAENFAAFMKDNCCSTCGNCE
jgi:hypothetical protein